MNTTALQIFAALAVLSAIDVTDLGPWAAMARLGLVMAQAEAVE